ncbi:MAG: hypothetical protein AB7N80_09545 [Bdellovibrionales bacterium]
MSVSLQFKQKTLMGLVSLINEELQSRHEFSIEFIITDEALIFENGFIEFKFDKEEIVEASLYHLPTFHLSLALSIAQAFGRINIPMLSQLFLINQTTTGSKQVVIVTHELHNIFFCESGNIFIRACALDNRHLKSSKTAALYLKYEQCEPINKLAI